jgi:hypothetical protein
MHEMALSGPANVEVTFTCYQSLLLASVETRNKLALLLQNHTLTKYSCNVQYLQVTYFSYYDVKQISTKKFTDLPAPRKRNPIAM